MITQNLYQSVLLSPCQEGADELRIVSGYADALIATRHLDDMKRQRLTANISLIIGMCPLDGIAMRNHKGFQRMMVSENFAGKFSCRYVSDFPQVHSKVYIWLKNKQIHRSFVGSANYTQNAFFGKQREVLVEICDKHVCKYFDELEKQSILCNDSSVEDAIRIYSDKNYLRNHSVDDVSTDEIISLETAGLEKIEISLLSNRGSKYCKKGDVPSRGGINWGQRPGRNPNQVYLQLPPHAYRSEFFPPNPHHFTVVSDDAKVFICVRREKDENGQTIHTPLNNALFGEWLRNRIGLNNGDFISKQALLDYGRTSITFYKIDNENYYMDFSVG